jgi:hypothetical protein
MEDTIKELLKRSEAHLLQSLIPDPDAVEAIQTTFHELKWQLLCVMAMSNSNSNVSTSSLRQLVPVNLNDLNEWVSLSINE